MTKLNFSLAIFLLLSFTGCQDRIQENFETDIVQYTELLRLPILVVGVAEGDSLIYFKALGSALNDTGTVITPDHMFPIASITKSFTATVMQQMEDKGIISLSDRIDRYPNAYFNQNRWNQNTTIAHVLSHTSESEPVGTNFIYNGGKYNVVFNVFQQINAEIDGGSVTKPFTMEIQKRILDPLELTHTLVEYNQEQHQVLKKFQTWLYTFDRDEQQYRNVPSEWEQMQCGPGYGMISSVTDLIKYSNSLNDEGILKAESYQRLTTPFYPGSPYGLGWFTTTFEGHDLHWGYGYGDYDSAILLRVPSKNLTLVVLSPCSIPSESTRLGFGNPLNSPIVASFVKNYLLDVPKHSFYQQKTEAVIASINSQESRVLIEEAFSVIATTLLSPTTDHIQKEKASEQLKALVQQFPQDQLWESTTVFEVIAQLENTWLLKHFLDRVHRISKFKTVHPAKLYFAGEISEKSGDQPQAISLFEALAEGSDYREQPYKFMAMMKLAKFYLTTQPELAKAYLHQLIRFKEFISVQDDQLEEAKTLLAALAAE